MLKATRVVLVEHMDDVLREALCLPVPDALFGPSRERWEYREGELVVIPGARPAAGSVPSSVVEAPAAELPGAPAPLTQ